MIQNDKLISFPFYNILTSLSYSILLPNPLLYSLLYRESFHQENITINAIILDHNQAELTTKFQHQLHTSFHNFTILPKHYSWLISTSYLLTKNYTTITFITHIIFIFTISQHYINKPYSSYYVGLQNNESAP